MNVLVTGATGFIGSHLCQALSQGGHTVSALSRNPATARRRVPSLQEAFPWEPLTKSPPPPEALAGVEAVVHLAGETLKGRWSNAKKRAIRESRVLGTRNLVQAIESAQSRPKVLLSASASGYYGDRGDEELTEQSSPGDGFLAGVAVAWEEEASQARGLGVRVATLRTGLVLGRGGGALGPLLPLFKLGLGGSLGSGRQWWSWVHQGDFAQFVLQALDSDWDGPVNLVAPQPVRQGDLARALGRVLSRPALLPAPALALRVILGEVATELLFSRRVIPAQAQAWGYRFRFPELEPALRDLLNR